MSKRSESRRASLTAAANHYAASVDAAAGYLTARGIGKETANIFRLGCALDPLPGDEDYIGRLAIPYITPAGVVDLRFRTMTEGSSPKYLGQPDAPTHLFNVQALFTSSDVVAVCEGELDTIIMHSLVGVPAVGVPGAQGWKNHYRLLLEDFERVVVMCDGDQAGREFGRKVASELDNVTVVHLPDGVDVNDAYLQLGVDFIRQKAGVA